MLANINSYGTGRSAIIHIITSSLVIYIFVAIYMYMWSTHIKIMKFYILLVNKNFGE